MSELTTRPAAADTWEDLEKLFGPRGACAGCWCMYWRLPGREFREAVGDEARSRLRDLVTSGAVPGLLAYRGDRAVGWCAVAPRSGYARLRRSPILPPELRDPAGVWAVPCFFVAAGERRRGAAEALLAAAVRYAADHGARVVEGYPARGPEELTSAELYVGTVGMFEALGFREAARRTPRRVLMRLGTG